MLGINYHCVSSIIECLEISFSIEIEAIERVELTLFVVILDRSN